MKNLLLVSSLFFSLGLLAISFAKDEKTVEVKSEPKTETKKDEPKDLPKATIDGTGLGWRAFEEKDFVNVNLDENTWHWAPELITCTGTPQGVLRTVKTYKNFEFVVQWRHMKDAGNSGIFVWADEKTTPDLKKNDLPAGIEIQILDQGYATNYERNTKKKPWFTTHGDVFSTSYRGSATKFTPFPPVAPTKKNRSFPSKELSKPSPEWNHYYVRAINGEVRLWVNGEEVSGGNGCDPSTGYICLESEGSPTEFKNFRIRELP